MTKHVCYSDTQVRGLLFGTLVGDVIGSRYTGYSTDQIAPLDLYSITKQPLKMYSDNTQMTISVFEEMAENGQIDTTSIGRRFLKRFSPWRGYSGGTLEVFEKWKDGQSFETVSGTLYNGVGSFGDGAAMRVAPISCFFSLHEFPEMIQEVKKCSRLTHTHVLGIDGAVVQAYVVLLALNKVPKNDWLKLLFELPVDSAYKLKFDVVKMCLECRANAHDSSVRIGNGSDALSAVSAAIFSVLRNSDSFIETVLFAIEQGGDTDTIGSMAGSIAGAWFGVNEIPDEVFKNIENGFEGKDFLWMLGSTKKDNIGGDRI
jgi:poly(ADP-ribose) glycohydrolase ARH3